MNNEIIKVLLIDAAEDDYILTRSWFRQFQLTTCDLEWVNSYQLARESIAQYQHDIYLVDYYLESNNGLKLLQEATENGWNFPFILLARKEDIKSDIEVIKIGAVDYLEKGQLTAPLLEKSIRYAIEKKQKDEKIHQQEILLDGSNDAIFIADLDYQHILFWNKAAERVYGWSAEIAMTKQIHHLFSAEKLPQLSRVLKVLTSYGNWEGELTQINKSQQEVIVASRWKLVMTFNGKHQSILVVNTDITQKKQLEQKFLRVQRLESIGTLASGIAHDLNNVLTPILMTAQILETQVKDEKPRQLIPILIANAKRGANLVKQVLSFARGMEGERTILQIKHLLIEIQNVIKETFPQSIILTTEIPQSLWTVCGDATQLHQVLMNLCINARDAMPNGGTLSIKSENLLIDDHYIQTHTDLKPGAYVLISIKDTGVGIKPTLIDRIFEPFFTTKNVAQGTGLGLSTVLGIVKAHGGFINVYSRENKGSEFQVYLPAQDTSEIMDTTEISPPRGQGETILVVDDEPAICEITKASLENYNYRVMTAHDGIEAIALYVEHRDQISLILTDIVMPSMDGLTSIRTLKKINPHLKIIAFSGLAPSDKVNAAYSMGVAAFLCKPFTATQLLQTISAVNGINNFAIN
ncbi:hybrid sensor histidine kinase/response regulator [Cylindrospermopsis raciborskii CENA303]|uniref:histidine kinase n=1 Tax=Cylindrospermopsis raciborskii CENA303 TaxID=1170769 RepID=A0A1X4G4M5_9CYAN|nr:response regulator [Cylindrospermopsis raciborskii]OSO89349.1 hybrid sensor histidine kinase/response regulator [Cylindrospermopsis raciborskii CENA303]